MLQRIALADRSRCRAGERLSVSGFADDTIVTAALRGARGRRGRRAGLERRDREGDPGRRRARRRQLRRGGRAPARERAPARAARPPSELAELAADDRRRRAVLPRDRAAARHAATAPSSRRSTCRADYWVVLVLPVGARSRRRPATVYRAFDDRDGADGFAERREALLAALASVRRPQRSRRAPAERSRRRLRSSERLLEAGAFRADVSGAGPCVYGLFGDRAAGRGSGRARCGAAGPTWVTTRRCWRTPTRRARAASTVGA